MTIRPVGLCVSVTVFNICLLEITCFVSQRKLFCLHCFLQCNLEIAINVSTIKLLTGVMKYFTCSAVYEQTPNKYLIVVGRIFIASECILLVFRIFFQKFYICGLVKRNFDKKRCDISHFLIFLRCFW